MTNFYRREANEKQSINNKHTKYKYLMLIFFYKS